MITKRKIILCFTGFIIFSLVYFSILYDFGINDFKNKIKSIPTSKICNCERDNNENINHNNNSINPYIDNDYNDPNKGNYIDIFKYFCDYGVTEAKNLSKQIPQFKDYSNKLWSSIIEVEPYSKIKVFKDPYPNELNCNNKLYSKFLTGKLSKKKRDIIEVFPFSHELDLLEARLFELENISNIVALSESEWTFRGHKKEKHFNNVKNKRFSQFLHKIIELDVDDCSRYKNDVMINRNKNNDDNIVWNIQDSHRSCIWKSFFEKINFSDETLILFSDADEIPSFEIMNHLKNCEIKENSFPLQLHIDITVRFNIRECNRPALNPVDDHNGNLRMNVGLGKYVKRDKQLSLRSHQIIGRNPVTIINKGAIHATYMGSSSLNFYKLINHGEGGSFPLLNINFCDITKEYLINLEEFYRNFPAQVIYPTQQGGLKQDLCKVISKEQAKKNWRFPWVWVENPERYPFIMGMGNYYQYSN